MSAPRIRVAAVHAETMNPGTPDEFVRIFVTCPMGHDLGSLSVESALAHPFHIDVCTHYEHKREDGR